MRTPRPTHLPQAFAVTATVLVAAACAGASADDDSAPTDLTLDYTAYVEGAVQPSGVGISPSGDHAAIVTDFERVVIVDVATQDLVTEFDVGRGELPEQGATEGIAYLDDGRLAVLYPDDGVVGVFDADGARLTEVELDSTGTIDGAITAVDGDAVVIERSDADAVLRFVDPDSGDSSSMPLDATEPLEGLSPARTDGALVGVTGDGEVMEIDPASGNVEPLGTAAEVGEPSGIELLPGDDEDGAQLGITDDADEFNDEPSPFRLYVLAE